ncbi:MAG: hypothetical protein QW648_04310 [Nanoarchaeales archaeon]
MMADNKILRNEIIETRKEIEKEIESIIKNTRFYKVLNSHFKYWYFIEYERLLLIYGGAGIGKSKTLRIILNDMNINYKIFLGERFEYYDKLNTLKVASLKHDVIVFDDCMISKRFANYFIDLLENGNKFIIVTNDLSELKANKFFARSHPIFVSLPQEDIHYILNHLIQKYNIEYKNVILLNLRDVVAYVLSELFRIDVKLTIEKLIDELDNYSNNYNALKNLIKTIILRYNTINIPLFENMAKQYFSYSDNTSKKYVRSILNELKKDADVKKPVMMLLNSIDGF